MIKLWLLVMLAVSGILKKDYPETMVEYDPVASDTGTGYFPFSFSTCERLGYKIPDTLRKYATLGGRDYRRDCESINSFLDYESETEALQAARRLYNLPYDARIMEAVMLTGKGYPDRMLIFWMHSPWVYVKCDNKYICSEYTSGSHFLGRARVSLVNVRTRTVINTIPIKFFETKEFRNSGVSSVYGTRNDFFLMPFYLGDPKQNKNNHMFRYQTKVFFKHPEKQGRAVIMHLSDYNRDGKSLEFALFNQISCNTCMTALYGYSPEQDKIINFPVHIKEINTLNGDSIMTERSVQWVDNLFLNKPQSKTGRWLYVNDYRMEGKFLEYYDILYNDSLQIFEGKMTISKK